MDQPNASDQKSLRRQTASARRAEIARHEIMRGLMSLPAGRAWVYRLLERCHVFQTTFSTEALSMAFQEGERNIGLELLADLMAASPDMFIAMLREAQNERSTREGLNGNVGGSDAGSGDYDPAPDDAGDPDPTAGDGPSQAGW